LTTDNPRLDFLRRRNIGSKALPQLREELRALLRTPSGTLDFISLETSDEIRAKVAATFPARDQLERGQGHYPFASYTLPTSETPKTLLPDGDDNVLVILPESDVVGVLRLPRQSFNENWNRLIEQKPDGCVVVNDALSDMLVVDREQQQVLVAAWGKDWSSNLKRIILLG
jgi:hypothetical protein